MIYYKIEDPVTGMELETLPETTVYAFCPEITINQVSPWRTTYLGKEVIIRRMFT